MKIQTAYIRRFAVCFLFQFETDYFNPQMVCNSRDDRNRKTDYHINKIPQ
jgi:hypothetical protein